MDEEPTQKKKNLQWIVAGILGIALLAGGYVAGFEGGQRIPKVIQVQGVSDITTPSSTPADMGVFWQVWQLLKDQHLKGELVDNQTKVYGAVKGLVASLGDPYTEFFTPQEGKDFQDQIQGNFGGIGAELGTNKQGEIVIIAPLKGTPADTAGLKPQDIVVKVNSSSTDGLSVDEVVSLIRGPIGSKVTLNMFRASWSAPRDIVIMRANIQVPTLDFQMKGNVAYVQLYSFNGNSDQLFFDAMKKAQAAGAQGLVLDLRNNPGGYLDVAVDLAGWFVKKGTKVVSEEGRSGVIEELKADGNEALLNVPTVIIMNGGSASASEILAGALRDIRGVQLVGEQSFGKGTVQELQDLTGGSTIKITIAHWVMPKGGVLENGGLKPDVEVGLTDADVAAKRDPQLDKAMEIIKGEISKSQ
jgi:carboxyl-terminal processing protease